MLGYTYALVTVGKGIAHFRAKCWQGYFVRPYAACVILLASNPHAQFEDAQGTDLQDCI